MREECKGGAVHERQRRSTNSPGKERMRILFLVHRLPYPPNKGDKIRSYWQLKTLAKQHDVDLFSFYDDPEDEKYIRDVNGYCENCYVEKLSAFWSRSRALSALVLRKPFSVAFFYSRSMARRVRRALESRSYDLIFVFSSSMAQYAESAKGIARIVDLVDVHSDKWDQYAENIRGPRAWLWRYEARRLAWYEASLVRSFSSTVVCTEAEGQLLRSKAPVGEIKVLQNFTDVDQYDPRSISLSDEIISWQPYVVFSGSMDYLPNVDAAQYFYHKVFPLVRSGLPGTRFVIAGRNPPQSVIDLASDPAVHVTGSVADIRPYLRGAAAAVAPMRIARGVQNKILESLATGVPVVTTSAAASALPVRLRSVLLVADTPREFASCVVKLLRNGSAAPVENIRSTLAHYIDDLDLEAQLEDLLASVVLRQSARPQEDEGPGNVVAEDRCAAAREPRSKESVAP